LGHTVTITVLQKTTTTKHRFTKTKNNYNEHKPCGGCFINKMNFLLAFCANARQDL
jgi:hypothetical protein